MAEHRHPLKGNHCAEGDYQELWQLFHKLWTAAVGKEGYVKQDWLNLEKELLRITRNGNDQISETGLLVSVKQE